DRARGLKGPVAAILVAHEAIARADARGVYRLEEGEVPAVLREPAVAGLAVEQVLGPAVEAAAVRDGSLHAAEDGVALAEEAALRAEGKQGVEAREAGGLGEEGAPVEAEGA